MDTLISHTLPKLEGCILSASGFRKVFAASGNPEDPSPEVSLSDGLLVAAMAQAYIRAMFTADHKPVLALGRDSRPTGAILAAWVKAAVQAMGAKVLDGGIVCAPQIMAWAGNDPRLEGFLYISASHNPVGHNGLKFGLNSGGVLTPAESALVIQALQDLACGATPMTVFEPPVDKSGEPRQVPEVTRQMADGRQEPVFQSSIAAYQRLSAQILGLHDRPDLETRIRQSLKARPLGIVADMNGSARCTGIDREFLLNLGLSYRSINDRCGEIVHTIVPEGPSLDTLAQALEAAHSQDPAFVLGYMPDNDGDRGNLVCYDSKVSRVRVLGAQEVFGLSCLATLAWHHVLQGNQSPLALAVNDPTSSLVDELAAIFGARVFRCEVGEANVVSLAQNLRQQGWVVPILGEGSNGGSILHPAAVRDPLNTLSSLVRLLALRDPKDAPWARFCSLCGLEYNADFDLGDILASLPAWTMASAYDSRALMQLASTDHRQLKISWEAEFLLAWDRDRDWLARRFGFHSWRSFNYEGSQELEGFGPQFRNGKHTGGLKICFYDDRGTIRGFVWFRPSQTEAVTRLLVEVKGQDPEGEALLLDWQRRLLLGCDGQGATSG